MISSTSSASRCNTHKMSIDDLPPSSGADSLLEDDEIDRLAADLTSRIRATIPSYGSMPHTEHQRTVRDQLALLVQNVTSGELPPGVLRLTNAAARRRAHYGMPVYDVLGAFGVVMEGLWEVLRRKHESDQTLLVDLVGPLARWYQAMSQAVVDAYVNESGSRVERERELRERLFAALAGQESDAILESVLSELAFDLRRPFSVLCWRYESWSLEDTEYLQRSGRQWAGVFHVGSVHEQMVLVAQDMEPDQLTARVLAVVGTSGAVGIGLSRVGAVGVAASLADAELALRVAIARRLTSVRYDDRWLECELMDSRMRISPLIQQPMVIAAGSPDLAAAVEAFGDVGFTLAGAAKRLHLHPNSVAYRLNRWQELTGLDPRSFPDLALSLTAISYVNSGAVDDRDTSSTSTNLP